MDPKFTKVSATPGRTQNGVSLGMDIAAYVSERLGKIQSKYNFNPLIGAKQVEGASPLVTRDFGKFQELMHLVKVLKVSVGIPYDEKGLDPKESKVIPTEKAKTVYFARVQGSNIWKVGCSQNPYNRVSALQVGHDGHLSVVMTLPGGFELETLFKRYLRKYKSRDRNHRKGEWFNIDPLKLKRLVSQVRKEGSEFMRHNTLPLDAEK